MIARNLKNVTEELALEKKRVSDLTDNMEAMSRVLFGVEGRMVNTELTAMTAVVKVTELKPITESLVMDLKTVVTMGQVETAKLRNDVKDYTQGTETTSEDLFAQLFAKLKKMEEASNAQTQGLNQLRAESQTYANAAGGNRTPRGARWEGQDDGGTQMEGAGE